MDLSIQHFLFFSNSEFNSIKSSVDSDYALSKLKRYLVTEKRVFVEMKGQKLHTVELYIFYSNIPTVLDKAVSEKREMESNSSGKECNTCQWSMFVVCIHMKLDRILHFVF